MIDIPFRVVDLIMKFAGAYSQDPYKSIYLEDIKLIMYPYNNVKQALWSIRFQKYEYKIISWDIFTQMIWGTSMSSCAYAVQLSNQR